MSCYNPFFKSLDKKITCNSQYKYILKIVGTKFKNDEEIGKLGGKDERRRYTIAKCFLEKTKLNKKDIENLSKFCSKHVELQNAMNEKKFNSIEVNDLIGYMKKYIQPKMKH